jgi:hypothetical protein
MRTALLSLFPIPGLPQSQVIQASLRNLNIQSPGSITERGPPVTLKPLRDLLHLAKYVTYKEEPGSKHCPLGQGGNSQICLLSRKLCLESSGKQWAELLALPLVMPVRDARRNTGR